MKTPTIVSDNLLDALTPTFFTTRGAVQSLTRDQSESGAPLESWADVAGATAIPCLVAPLTSTERYTAAATITTATHRALLAGRFPTITPAQRFVADGVTYNIIAVNADSHGPVMSLDLQIVSV